MQLMALDEVNQKELHLRNYVSDVHSCLFLKETLAVNVALLSTNVFMASLVVGPA